MKFSLLAAATMATAAFAQGLSQQCTVQVGLLAIGDLGQCLALQQLLGVVNGNDPIVSSLNTYLGALCSSSTPKCSNQTLTSASSTIQNSCKSDLESTGEGATALSVLDTVFKSYPQFYTAACSRNETTNQYCVISTLSAVQNATNQTLDASYVTSLLGGSSQGLSQLNEALNDGQLCTGCVAGIYRQAIAANSSVTSIPAISSIASRCGSGFGTSASETGVSSSSLPSGTGANAGTPASSSASRSPTSGAMITATFGMSGTSILALVAVAGGVLAGGIAVL